MVSNDVAAAVPRIGYQARRKIAHPTALPAVQKINYLNHGLLGGNLLRRGVSSIPGLGGWAQPIERQEQRKHRPPSPFALAASDVHPSAVPLYDLLADPQAQACSANPFGRKEWLENLLHPIRNRLHPLTNTA